MSTALTAVSPIDGRYSRFGKAFEPYFSEFALFKYRTQVEVEYFIALCEFGIPQLAGVESKYFASLRAIYTNFSLSDAQKIKDIEKVTNHDVKAVEYFLKEQFDELGLSQFKEFIHFGLTSQDINNTSVPLSIKHAVEHVVIPAYEQIIAQLTQYAEDWKNISMLARTHGQPASPTTLGKEIFVFVERLTTQLNNLKATPISGKFGGATGNFNAHKAAFSAYNWPEFGNQFLKNYLGIDRQQNTTQIEHYDQMAALFDACKRLNTIILDIDRDFWTYISMDYFKQKIKAGEVGSSAMPHKVNPIDFENSEGNIGIANAFFEHLSAKLPVSRMQRDLTDSTVLRNIGVPFAHSYIAIQATLKGLGKLLLNESAFENDLEQNWAVVAEAIQTVLRREAYPNPYEALKGLTRTNEKITQQSIHAFIDTLEVNDAIKTELKAFTPSNYTGYSYQSI